MPRRWRTSCFKPLRPNIQKPSVATTHHIVDALVLKWYDRIFDYMAFCRGSMTQNILAPASIEREPSVDVSGLDPVDVLLALHGYAEQAASRRAAASQPEHIPEYPVVRREEVLAAIRKAQEDHRRHPGTGLIIRTLGDFVLNTDLSELHDGAIRTAGYDIYYGRDAGRTAIDRLRIRLFEEQEARLDAEYKAMLAQSTRHGCLDISTLRPGKRAELLVALQHYAAHEIDRRYNANEPYLDGIGDTGDPQLWLISLKAAKRALRHSAKSEELTILGNVRMGALGMDARSKYLNVNGNEGFDTLFGNGSEAVRYVMRGVFHPNNDGWLVHKAAALPDSAPLPERLPQHSVNIFDRSTDYHTVRLDPLVDRPSGSIILEEPVPSHDSSGPIPDSNPDQAAPPTRRTSARKSFAPLFHRILRTPLTKILQMTLPR